jgi:hypothetical protein
MPLMLQCRAFLECYSAHDHGKNRWRFSKSNQRPRRHLKSAKAGDDEASYISAIEAVHVGRQFRLAGQHLKNLKNVIRPKGDLVSWLFNCDGKPLCARKTF